MEYSLLVDAPNARPKTTTLGLGTKLQPKWNSPPLCFIGAGKPQEGLLGTHHEPLTKKKEESDPKIVRPIAIAHDDSSVRFSVLFPSELPASGDAAPGFQLQMRPSPTKATFLHDVTMSSFTRQHNDDEASASSDREWVDENANERDFEFDVFRTPVAKRQVTMLSSPPPLLHRGADETECDAVYSIPPSVRADLMFPMF